jgi:hypothetical protein
MAQSMHYNGAVETLQEDLIFYEETKGYHSSNKIHMIICISHKIKNRQGEQ